MQPVAEEFWQFQFELVLKGYISSVWNA